MIGMAYPRNRFLGDELIGKRYLIHDRALLSEHQAERLHPLDPIQTTLNSRTV
jgi:hypothetical protein